MGWGFEFVEVDKELGGRKVLDGVSFAAPAGAVTALVGPAQAGKTTAFRLACALDRADAGAVLVAGVDVGRSRGRTLRRTQRRMAAVFAPGQDAGYALFESATAAENVAFAVRQAGRSSKRRLEGVVATELERFGLADRADVPPPGLSARERKLLALARALALGSPLLVVDDVAADVGEGGSHDVAALGEILRAQARRRAATCLVTTDDEAAAEQLADQIHVLGQVPYSASRHME